VGKQRKKLRKVEVREFFVDGIVDLLSLLIVSQVLLPKPFSRPRVAVVVRGRLRRIRELEKVNLLRPFD
jgi:hypothetical protein